MVFLIEVADSVADVVVYESIADVTGRLEWQDIFEGGSIILDEQGRTYGWDKTQAKEYGTTYDYTLTAKGVDYSLRDECIRLYNALGNPAEFIL